MRLALAVIALALAAEAVEAKPLPPGMKVSLKKEKLYVSQGGVTVPMRDEESALADPVSEYTGAELSEDGTEIVVAATSCRGSEDGLHISLASVNARFENVRGMKLHLKKKYADAIPHFAAAAKADPATPVYATNLLSAQSMAKLLDDADATLATYAPKHRAWFAWRLAVDKELANVRTRPGARALLPVKPSTLEIDPMGDAVAVSPAGLVAVREWVFYGGPGAPDGGFDLAIYDPRQDIPAVRLTGIPYSQACGAMGESCTKAELAKQAASKKKLDPVLAGMGFEKIATAWVSTTGEDGSSRDVITSPDKSISIKLSEADGHAKIRRGKATVTVELSDSPRQIGFAGSYVVFQFREQAFIACDGDAQRSYSDVVRVE